MQMRILVCAECGAEWYFDLETITELVDNGGECSDCGALNYIDYGWGEIEEAPAH